MRKFFDVVHQHQRPMIRLRVMRTCVMSVFVLFCFIGFAIIYNFHKASQSLIPSSQSMLAFILPDAGGKSRVRTYNVIAGITKKKYSCFPWKENTDDWWTHNPSWEIAFENETHYCFSPIQNEKKAKLFRELYDIGFSPNTNCSNVLTVEMMSAGWGADVRNIVDALRHSIQSKRPLQMYGKWHYAGIVEKFFNPALLENNTVPTCPRWDMHCYFLTFTHCPPNPNNVTEPNMFDFWNSTLYGESNRWIVEYILREQTWLRHESYQFVNQHLMAYRPPPLDTLWQRKAIKASSNRVDNNTAELIKERIRKLPFSSASNCVPVHVRRSDVVMHEEIARKYHAISEYLEALWNVSNYHNPVVEKLTRDERPFLLLLTDDANAIGEALVLHSQYPWMYLDRPRFRGVEGGWENQFPTGSPRKEVVVLQAIRRLIRRCKHPFVHSNSGFADYLRGIMEEVHEERLHDENIHIDEDPPLYVNLDDFASRETIYAEDNNQTFSISQNIITL